MSFNRAIFGSAPFFSMIPHGRSVTNDTTYLLVVVLAVVAGLIGIGFKTFLYWLEDFVDELWKGRPEWRFGGRWRGRRAAAAVPEQSTASAIR